MAFMQISIVPVGTGSTSVGEYVADLERFLEGKNVEHNLHDMGTVICGPTGDLLRLAEEMHRLPFTRGAKRVITNITLDDRQDHERGLGDKERSVRQRLRKQ